MAGKVEVKTGAARTAEDSKYEGMTEEEITAAKEDEAKAGALEKAKQALASAGGKASGKKVDKVKVKFAKDHEMTLGVGNTQKYKKGDTETVERHVANKLANRTIAVIIS